MPVVKTNLCTDDGLVVYDLDELAGELWAVAGPDGYDPALLDPDNLPEGFRWVDGEEWEELQPVTGKTETMYTKEHVERLLARCPKCGKSETMYNNCGSGALLCEECDPGCPCCVGDESPFMDDDEDEEDDEFHS